MSTNSHLLKILGSLRDRAYRALFVETQIETLIPFQIRAMRLRRGWTQKALAKEADMAQGRISLLESPNYEGAVNIKTLLKLAAAFDVGLVVRFAPFSEVAEWSGKLSRESHEVPTYDMEVETLSMTHPECGNYEIRRNTIPVKVHGAYGGFSVGSFTDEAA
jgi:transcriptional regulator with XRE-family HTH domain